METRTGSVSGNFLRCAIAIILVLTAFSSAVPTLSGEENSGAYSGTDHRIFLPVDVFDEYFVDVQAEPRDENGDGKNDTVRILFQVDTEGAKENVEVFMDVFNSSGNLLVTYSKSFMVISGLRFQAQYFDYYARYSDFYNFSLRLYDTTHGTKENYGNNYEVPKLKLEPYRAKFEIWVTATPFDRDNDGFNDDVRVTVKDINGLMLEGVQAYIDGSLKGTTDENGTLSSQDYERGFHEVDVFYHRVHANTDFKSEGNGVPEPILVDCDPEDFDGIDVDNDVTIYVTRENSLPVRDAEVYIDGVFYGTTMANGMFRGWNFDEGFHYVNVKGLNQWQGSVFYAEPLSGPGDYDEFIRWAQATEGNFDGGAISNDIEVSVDIGLEGGAQSNVSINATLMLLNYTEIETTTIDHTAYADEWYPGYIYFYNLSKDSYRIYLELFDMNGKLEDTWMIEEVVITHNKQIVNVDRGVFDLDDSGDMDDLIFFAHIMDNSFEDGYVKVMYSMNGTVYRNESLVDGGTALIADLPVGSYNWSAYNNYNELLETGGLRIYSALVFDVQTQEYQSDHDFDGFYDDFHVYAYDSNMNMVNTVYVYIWDKDNNVFKEGYTSALTPGGPGRFLVTDIPEGNFTYEARTTSIPQRVLSNGSFYSYGNNSEASSFLNVFTTVKNIDNDGNNDVVVKVTDFFNQPVAGARVFFDRDMTYFDTTDSNGEVTAYDFEYGWHHVDVYKVSGRPRGHAYTQFFSEGFDYNIYFDYVTAYQSDADDDGEVNDLTVYVDVDVVEDIMVEVTVVATLFYQDNGSYFAKNFLTFETADQWFDPVYIHFYDLAYNETFNATYRLYDEQDKLEDEWIQYNITIEIIGNKINIDLYYEALVGREVNQSGVINYPLISFHAHRDMISTNNVTIKVFDKTQEILVYELRTEANGLATISDPEFDYDDYYWHAYDSSGDNLEFRNEFLGHLNLSTSAYLTDVDEDTFWDDFRIVVFWGEVNPLGQVMYYQVNTTVKFWDANKQLIIMGYTDPASNFDLLNLTEGQYIYSIAYDGKTYDIGTFYSNGNGFENQAPHVEISSPADNSEYFDIDKINFDGTGSYDPDEYDRLVYDWRSDIDGFLSDKPSFSTSLSQGKHKITLTVDDAHGNLNSTSITLQILSFAQPNAAPRAVISSPKENDKYYKGDNIYFDGANSTDDVPANLTFTWESNVTGTLNGNSSKFFMSLPAGRHQITLTVDDGGGLNSTDIVNITVENRAPVANLSSPEDGAQFNASDNIFFSAAGSADPDGDSLDYIWESNISGVLFSGTIETFSTSLSGGVHRINLTVSDGELNDTASITITVVNTPPVANITRPVEGGTYFKGPTFFDGSASMDPDGDILYFYWELDGSAVAGNVSSFSTNVTDLGDHTIELFVTDGLANVSAMANFTIENRAPVAIAGPDQTINMNGAVDFNASQSYDPDGDEITFIWDFDATDGTNQIDAEGAVVTHTYTLPGDFIVTLTVNDGSVENNTARDNLTIHVNRAPIAKAGPDITRAVGQVIYFNASDSSDPDGDILTYSWDFGDGATGKGMNVSYSYSTDGTYTVTLNVSDSHAWDIDTLKVTIVKPNRNPNANAGPDMVVNISSAVQFNASGSSDPDGDTLVYIWDFDASDGTDDEDALGLQVTHSYTAYGKYTVTLTVEDGKGGNDTDTLLVTVNAPPVIDVVEVNEAFLGQSVTFDASGTEDPENHLIFFTWDFGDETDTKIGDRVTHAYTEEGTFTVTLTVRDLFYASSSYDFEITIKPIPVPDISRPRDGDTVNGNVDIQGSADFDIVKHVQIYIYKVGGSTGSPVKTVDVSSDGSWSFTWDSEGVKNDNYNIEIRGTTAKGDFRSDARKISITVENEEIIDDDGDGNQTGDGEPDEGMFDFITGLGLITTIGCCAVGIIILLVIIMYVVRSRGRGKRAPAAAIAAAQMDMYKQVEAAEEEPSFQEIAEEEEEKKEEVEGIKRPIKCPSCGEIFITKDTGERPWMLWCTQCGARGLIKEDATPKLPPAKEERKKEEKKAAEERKREKVKCPECTEIFSVWSDEREIECPNCGVIGEK